MKKKDAPTKFGFYPYPPFADNIAGFSGFFPGSSPDLNTPASSSSEVSFLPASISLGAGFLLFLKKEAKNKKLLGVLDEIRRTSWLRKFLLA